ncbi:MAG: gas vesicle protein [Cyanobacteria bacterium]|nr:gas vesicle protein [Cyanobacteriota bacterium]MDW8201214.1 gas vesicle protein [Cyanobacteriota bacterium SKYGB_h_bin112]
MNRPSIPAGQIRPKISNMPRQQSEDQACLEVYKLVVERKRLQRELDRLEQRKAQIQNRIHLLETEIRQRDQEIQQSRRQVTLRSPSPVAKTPSQPTPPKAKDPGFDMLTLEY